MSSPTPLPGWHPDPANPSLVRYWDGARWTEHTQPAAGPTLPADGQPAPDEADRPHRKGVPRAVKILVGIVAAFVVLGIIGSLFGDPDSSSSDSVAEPASETPGTTAATSSETPTTTNTTTAAPAPPTTTAAAPSPTTAFVSDPRCAPANQSLVDQVASGFSESGLTLTNGTIIDTGDYTYVGGTTIDSSGRVENRSDVWVISDGTVYASTGGARNTTTWPRASSELGISPGDPDVQALDTCVVNLTR